MKNLTQTMVVLGCILALGRVGNANTNYPDFMSFSSNLVLVQIKVLKNGAEVPVENVDIKVNDVTFKPSAFVLENNKKIPTGELEVGRHTIAISYEGQTMSEHVKLSPIMRKVDYPNLDLLNSGEYAILNVVRVTLDLDSAPHSFDQ